MISARLRYGFQTRKLTGGVKNVRAKFIAQLKKVAAEVNKGQPVMRKFKQTYRPRPLCFGCEEGQFQLDLYDRQHVIDASTIGSPTYPPDRSPSRRI